MCVRPRSSGGGRTNGTPPTTAPSDAPDATVFDPGGAPGSFACPVCGAAVEGVSGAYDICARCGWEDDPVQADDPIYAGGANTMSLADARADWLRRQNH